MNWNNEREQKILAATTDKTINEIMLQDITKSTLVYGILGRQITEVLFSISTDDGTHLMDRDFCLKITTKIMKLIIEAEESQTLKLAQKLVDIADGKYD